MPTRPTKSIRTSAAFQGGVDAFPPGGRARGVPGLKVLAAARARAGLANPPDPAGRPGRRGNAGDTIARIVLDQVSKQIGQSFVIENRTGAGGTIGSAS